MKIIGKFTSGEFSGDFLKIFFHLENTKKIFPQIHPFLNSGIMVTFNEMVTYEGEIEGESSHGDRMTIFLSIKIDPKKIGILFSLRNEEIFIEMTIDKNARKTQKGMSKKFLKKCSKTIEKMGKHLGYTEKEMRRILENRFTETADEPFKLFSADKTEDIELFYKFIIDFAEDEEIPIGDESSVVDTKDAFLRIRRQQNLCCICEQRSDGIIGIYPLCNKHRTEVEGLKTEYPKSWASKFKNKYHL